MSINDQYALNWSNHTAHLKKAFESLLTTSEYVDVTLACEGKKISAHKMLLSACSPYFQDLFRDNPCQHPIVILRDVQYQHLLDILKFIYNGEVSVPIETFDSFLKTAEFLQISGLTDDEGRIAPNDNNSLNETTYINFEQNSDVETKPTNKLEINVKRLEKLKKKPAKRNTEISPTIQKRRKDNIEAITFKKENSLNSDNEDYAQDPLDISNENHEEPEMVNVSENEPLQEIASPQKFNNVKELLGAKVAKVNKSKCHKLEERIGKLEANRSYCKGCFVKTRIGHITKDKIKKVNTFCPGCSGLPNFCKSCFKIYHKNIVSTE